MVALNFVEFRDLAKTVGKSLTAAKLDAETCELIAWNIAQGLNVVSRGSSPHYSQTTEQKVNEILNNCYSE